MGWIPRNCRHGVRSGRSTKPTGAQARISPSSLVIDEVFVCISSRYVPAPESGLPGGSENDGTPFTFTSFSWTRNWASRSDGEESARMAGRAFVQSGNSSPRYFRWTCWYAICPRCAQRAGSRRSVQRNFRLELDDLPDGSSGSEFVHGVVDFLQRDPAGDEPFQWKPAGPPQLHEPRDVPGRDR